MTKAGCSHRENHELVLRAPDSLTVGNLASSFAIMKTLEVELPDALAGQLDELVKAGLYLSSQEAVRHALRGFLETHVAALTERQQLADIDWALRDAPAK